MLFIIISCILINQGISEAMRSILAYLSYTVHFQSVFQIRIQVFWIRISDPVFTEKFKVKHNFIFLLNLTTVKWFKNA